MVYFARERKLTDQIEQDQICEPIVDIIDVCNMSSVNILQLRYHMAVIDLPKIHSFLWFDTPYCFLGLSMVKAWEPDSATTFLRQPPQTVVIPRS